MKLALVGSETLLGKEIEDVVKSRTGTAVIDFAANGEGNLGEVDGEAVYVEALTAETIADMRAIILAGTPDGAQKAYDLAKRATGQLLLVDCTGQLESHPESRLIAPLAEDFEPSADWLLVIAHPAASALALVMKRLARYRPVERVVATIFEPASEQGKRGIAELHQQTTSLLSFKPLDKDVFDSQLSFNLLSQYGEASTSKLAAVEGRIAREISAVLKRESATASLPQPSLRVVAAPVFHGYSLSIWVQFGGTIHSGEIGEALASAQIEVRSAGDEPPDSVSAASQSGLIAGDIRVDSNDKQAAWLWVVGDNLRLMADGVADVVGTLQRSLQ